MGPNLMKRTTAMVAALAVTTTAAIAGGQDRSGQPISIIFEEGRYLQFSGSFTNPDVTGIDPTNQATGSAADSYIAIGAGYKADFNENLSYAVILDEPYGANPLYGPSGSIYSGTQANIDSFALTGLLRYKMDGGFSVHGGVSLQQISADATISRNALNAAAVGAGVATRYASNYTIDTDTSQGAGYVLGAAFEKPEIALRVSLTYHSSVDHEVDATEAVTVLPAGAGGAVVNLAGTNKAKAKYPEAVNLEFQTGIMADTLLFGSVRWANWSEYELRPTIYNQATRNPIVSYANDGLDYAIGVGRRFNDNWAGSFRVSWQPEENGATGGSVFAPANGRTGYAIGVEYSKDNLEIGTGIQYTDLGDANRAGLGNFSGNSALSVGVRVGIKL